VNDFQHGVQDIGAYSVLKFPQTDQPEFVQMKDVTGS